MLYADRTRLTGDLGAILARPSVMNGHRCLATLVYVAPDAENRLEALRGLFLGLPAIAAASAWNGMLTARLVARDYYDVMLSLRVVLEGFRNRPLPRVWTI